MTLVPRDSYKLVPGTFTFPEFYDWLATQMPVDGQFVEVGIDHGQSLLYMGSVWGGTIHGVDQEAHKLSDTTRAMLGSRFNFVHDTSLRAASHFGTEELDAVFIDADHSGPAVAADIAAWWPCVRRGGILAGHDFSAEHFPGLCESVMQFVADTPGLHLNEMRGSKWQKCDARCFGDAWHGHIVRDNEPGIYLPVWWVRKP